MKEELLIIIFLLLGPVLDILSFYNIPVNIVFRGLFLGYIIFSMLKNKKNIKLLLVLLIFSLIEFLYQIIGLNYSYINSISNIFKFLYLPCTFLYFKDYEFKKYNKNKILSIILFTYITVFLLSYITKTGSNIYLEEEGKKGFKGVFSSINEFSAIVSVLLIIVSNYLKNNKKYILLFILFLETILCSMLLGTKVLFAGIIISIIYLMYQERNRLFFNRNITQKVIIILSSIVVIISGIFIFTKTRTYSNMMVQKDFFKVNNVLSYEYLNRVIYNDRLSFLEDNFKYYKDANIENKLLGIGVNNNIKMVEIDVFDILFRYGIIGFIIFIYILIKILSVKTLGIKKFSIILLLLISLTSGHVLTYPNVCIYIGLILANVIEYKRK